MKLSKLRGQQFGSLTVIRRAPAASSKNAYWLCRCDCGSFAVKEGSQLKRGEGLACRDCLFKHGVRVRDHHLYSTWSAMVQRCHNPKCPNFTYYGGKGITVCERWLDIGNYIADIEALDKPSPQHSSIDRIDNNGNYEPGNVRWATKKEQALNRRPRRPHHRKHVKGYIRLIRIKHRQGESYRAIGRACGIDHGTVKRVLERMITA
jgi:hypothetical protein